MPRAKTGVVRRRKHKRLLEKTKGYYGTRSKLVKRAKEAFIRAGEHAFAGRKLKKRDFRSLWILRINAALREEGLKYSDFIGKLNKSGIKLNRKVLANLAVENNEVFKKLVAQVKA